MKYRYAGDVVTYHPQLGRLDPGTEGEGPDDLVALCIAGGLLEAVENDAPAQPDETTRRV